MEVAVTSGQFLRALPLFSGKSLQVVAAVVLDAAVLVVTTLVVLVPMVQRFFRLTKVSSKQVVHTLFVLVVQLAALVAVAAQACLVADSVDAYPMSKDLV